MMEWEDKFKSNLLEVLYRADQPRDEKGRWTSGGAGAGSVEDSKVYNWALNKFGDAQTAKNFTEWFGDSKVVDANGNPMVVYHGTGADFDEFDLGKATSSTYLRKAVEDHYFFTDDPARAGIYAEAHAGTVEGVGPSVVPVYLKIENPLIAKTSDADTGTVSGLLEDAIAQGKDGVILTWKEPSEMARKFPMVFGDEVVIRTTHIVFDSTQIKSATVNIGTFDPNDPNITNWRKSE